MSVFDDKKKIEVVTTWLALGKVPMVAGITGVSVHTIRQWKMQPWWKELVGQIQEESAQELDTKLTKIIDKSLDVVNERIEGGEFVLNSKTGQVERVPVKLKDVHRVASDLLDKRDLVRGRPSQRKEEALTHEILKKLAQQMAEWGKRKEKTIEGEVLDIEMARPTEGSTVSNEVVRSNSERQETTNLPESGRSGEVTTVLSQNA